jgi:hypothetical protein
MLAASHAAAMISASPAPAFRNFESIATHDGLRVITDRHDLVG